MLSGIQIQKWMPSISSLRIRSLNCANFKNEKKNVKIRLLKYDLNRFYYSFQVALLTINNTVELLRFHNFEGNSNISIEKVISVQSDYKAVMYVYFLIAKWIALVHYP